MTTARKQLIDLKSTPYYHCVSRCVRRSFLCGEDALTGKNYEHRRGWVEDRVKQLTTIYCIGICAYAVMSNHYHLVVYVDHKSAVTLSDHEVVERWGKLHAIPALVTRWLRDELTKKSELHACYSIIEQWRKRLSSLSWFMKELNYFIARKANQEDDCKGHFWESRFKSQALLDDAALVAAMAYVDLNPVRSGEAMTPESSPFTSIRCRLMALKQKRRTAAGLMGFQGAEKQHRTIPYRFSDYLALLDWTGRQFREGKGSIPGSLPAILERLTTSQHQWLHALEHLSQPRATKVGLVETVNNAKAARKCGRVYALCL
ncbi:transposase [Vibrio agarivorans]|uniref:transposase n=1 Tax=Vibrio agarivorans TaxID=153622 RepID=UPI00222E3336|nr:transposase [Vibrio agarivorans]MDN3660328.1 transposase [Vibrio agarivorans]